LSKFSSQNIIVIPFIIQTQPNPKVKKSLSSRRESVWLL